MILNGDNMSYINNLEKAKLFKSDELVKTYSGQIISTKLSDNSSLTLELYSFDKGEEISKQKAIYDTFFYVVKGEIEISNDLIKENEYKTLNKGEDTHLVAKEPTVLLMYLFKKEGQLKNLNKTDNKSLIEEVSFVDNSVASKVVYQDDILSLTLLALDEDQGLNTHSASGDVLVVSLGGEVLIKIGDEEFNLSGDDLIVLPAGIPHSLMAKKPYKMFIS
ncbi:MAG: AraC family ligand binding domain-containing protein, partial [Sphaerochaetaceae bacterium]|nr:AraC family ligand binding domain-containing protein [Sphaerochaetaceae bacterium]